MTSTRSSEAGSGGSSASHPPLPYRGLGGWCDPYGGGFSGGFWGITRGVPAPTREWCGGDNSWRGSVDSCRFRDHRGASSPYKGVEGGEPGRAKKRSGGITFEGLAPMGCMTAQQEFDDVVQWLRQYGGDVDHHAFLTACDRAVIQASQEAGFRVPRILGQGYKTLDFAAVLLRTYIPSDAMHPSLPGAF